ncbi:hypothetical protein Tco_0382017 [Tanacetum coccineum]
MWKATVTVSDDQYAVFNRSEYACTNQLSEYAVLDRELDTPYPMEVDTPHRYVVSSLMDTAYWLSEQPYLISSMDNDLYPYMLTAITGWRWVVGHGFRLAVYKCARSIECRSALGKVISMATNKGIQQGLEDGVVHGGDGRSLSQIEAYDPDTEGKYVAVVSEFENVYFPLLDELEISVPIYSESGSIEREMLLSDAILAICESDERRRLCPPLTSTLGLVSSSVPSHGSSLGVADY